ncbi:MAG TPA: alpha/beta hydrolase [Syntrophales bacterium]|nr:alpha/beta hydrolase [Syntrophales bacterium]
MEMPAERWLDINGLSFRYLDWGGEGLPFLALLHGIGDSAHVWDLFAREARRHFRIVALDQRGHGRSGRPRPAAYRLDDYVGDLEAVVERLAPPNLILMGHSMGALHATAFAARHPGFAAAVVHVDIEPCPPPWNKKYLTGLYRDLPESYESVDAFVSRRMENSAHADRARLLALSPHNLREENGRYYALSDREVYAHFDPDYDLRALLPGIACPVLVVRGEDSLVLPREPAEEMCRSLPRGFLAEIPRAAHPVHTDNPEAFREAVFRFLADQGLMVR